jgi:hypothetical protein
LRQSYEFVVDIGWQALVIDDDLNCVFFCFNSMEESNFARGCITNSQLKRMTASLNEEHARRKRLRYKDLDRYTKIALIHHHPFAYETIATELYDKVVRFTFGDEDTFVRFEEANGFVSWCAELGVSLILHGHKHEPHRVQVSIPIGDRHHSLLAIGCGSTTGAGGSPLSYDVVALNPETGRWSATFYEDPSNAGAGFRIRELTLDTRRTTSSW